MNERERLDVLVRLALEARSESFIKRQLAKAQENGNARQLPELQSVVRRAQANEAVSYDCLNYTYGL